MTVLRIAASSRPALVPTGLEAPLQRLTAAFAVLAANSALIEQQPDLSLAVLPTLPEDQALVRSHVGLYQSSTMLSGGIMACFQAVATIAHAVQNMAHGLLPVAAKIDAHPAETPEHDEAIAGFRSALQALGRSTISLDPDTRSAALKVRQGTDALAAFLQNQIADDATRFEEAKVQAAKAGTIDRLQLQIDALMSQMDGLNRDIAAGATSQIIPAMAFGFKIGKAIATETETGALLVSVGFAIKDEIDEANAFAKMMRAKNAELNGLIDQYRSLVEQQISAQQEIATVLTIAGHSAVFRDNLEEARQAAAQVLGQLMMLHNGLEYLATVDAGDAPNYFTDQLQAAIAGWAAIGETVEHDLAFTRALGGDAGSGAAPEPPELHHEPRIRLVGT
jgi:hypothetical protein